MPSIRKVLRNVLLADANVTAKLATFEFTTGTPAPAIFTTDDIPDGAAFPAIRLMTIGGPEFACRGQRGADINVDVSAFDDKGRSGKAVEELGVAVWEALNRADLHTALATEGYEDWGCRAEWPVSIDDPDGYPGYLVMVRARVLKAE